ncbi:hypothetical protein [Pseudomonas brassicacearum]|uniref:hypothetical protein n=1 Tax=Pseudomonas brassicacearum TaxID=930166 RepID=UPI0004176370|nr:hypothetical protein [Pseudomonas brassicacearum]
MTNKITLSREHVERLIERLGKSQMFKETTELRAAMAQSERQLVGLPERHDLPHRDEFETANQYTSALDTAKTWNAACDEWAPHVTWLQAEVERLLTEIESERALRVSLIAQWTSHRQDLELAVNSWGSVAEQLQSELTSAQFLVDQALHLQTEHYGDGMGLHLAMIKWARAANQSAPAAKDDCAHSEANRHGCPECGEEFKRAPALIETLRANGDRITMEATIAQQAQRIADLEASQGQGGPLSELEVLRAAVKELEALRDARVEAKLGQGEPVSWADPLAFSNFKAHAHLGGPYDHEWMWAKPAHAGMVPLYLHAEQPTPVAVVLAEAREWLGDGKNADGLAREHWTPEYAALIDRIDATLSK